MSGQSKSSEAVRNKLPANVTVERNRHGTPVTYYRIGKGYRTRLPDYGTDAFWAAHKAITAGEPFACTRKAKNVREGTLAWLVVEYKQSLHFRSLGDLTRRRRDSFFRQMVEKSGDVLLSRFTEQMVIAGREKLARGKGHAANNFLKAVKPMFAYAKMRGWIEVDPARNVDFVKTIKGGFRPWTRDDWQAYEARHPVGTMANLAARIMLFVGLRRSDAVKFGEQHIRNGVITFTPGKTEGSSGVTISFTALPPLVEAIKATQELRTRLRRKTVTSMAFLMTEHGAPFSSGASFGNWFRDRCEEAGVPARAHGLRKLGPTLAAENGATSQELMAMWGWTTLAQAELYTRAANRRALGDSAAAKLMAGLDANGQNANSIPRTLEPGAGIERKSE